MVCTDFNVQLVGLMKLTILVILMIRLLVVALAYGKNKVSLSTEVQPILTEFIVQPNVGEKM